MLRPFAKIMLTATSLAPVCGAFAVNAWSSGNLGQCVVWLVVAVGLTAVCRMTMLYAEKHMSVENLEVVKIKSSDKEVLAFLLTYLLPLIAKDTLGYDGDTATGVYVFLIIFVSVYHSNAFHFNPMLGLLFYHFYEVQSKDGMTFLLITPKTLRKQSLTLSVTQLTDYMFLEVEASS